MCSISPDLETVCLGLTRGSPLSTTPELCRVELNHLWHADIASAPLDSPVDTRHMSAALSKAMCMVNRVKQAAELNDCTAHPRVLVLHTSADTTSQYVACMNAAFSARRLGVPVDGMPLTGQVSSYIELVLHPPLCSVLNEKLWLMMSYSLTCSETLM